MKLFVIIIREVFATLPKSKELDAQKSLEQSIQKINEQTEQENQEIPMPQLSQETKDYIEEVLKYDIKKDALENAVVEPEKIMKNIETDEEKKSEPQKFEPSVENENPKDKLELYAYIGGIGQTVGNGILGFFSFLAFIIGLPVKKIWSLLKMMWAWLDIMFFNSVRTFRQEWSIFKSEVKSARKNILRAIKESPKSLFSIFGHYIKKALNIHPKMFKSITNIALPALAAVALVTTIGYWKGATFALKVENNGQRLGYISDESVYLTAQELVKERLETKTGPAKEVIGTPAYSIALVKPNELTDAQTISDKLVESTNSSITPACGVYINDEFICAIKNEMDAMQLFNGILGEYEKTDENDVVGFVEDVKYVQGLYPDNEETIWDSQKLRQKIQGKKAEAVYYKVQEGDTVSGIAQKNGIRSSELFAMNPSITEMIRIGDELLVSNEVNYLRVKVVKTEVVDEEIPFETIKTDNSNLFKGSKKVKRNGSVGKSQVTRLVTYVDGVRVSAEEINRVTIKNPVDELVDIGTKSATVSRGSKGPKGSGVSGVYNATPTSGKLVWPIIGLYRVNSPYGPRNGGFHGGIDLSGPNASGHIVVAAASGRVTAAGWGGPYGYRVIVDHGGGMSTLYAHCLAGSVSVGVGQSVSAGQAIARVGSTGNSTGPHLHFEVRIGGNRVNPAPYLGLSR
ncbi:MAG: peptidoglycan DD-metalloendopeptidase family protein [Clostridiales bacterium]|nr:peptidoglycan DD-metalloendopeptidase family protein [Clostridiales bacterium]